MSIFKSIDIKNFRGLDSIQLQNLAKINVFVGKNNCGKSTVLEALFMLLGMSNPYIPVNVNKFRSLGLMNVEHLRFLFNKADLKKTPMVSGVLSNNTGRRLTIEPNYTILHDTNSDAIIATDTKAMFMGLNIGFDIIDENETAEHHHCTLPVNSQGIVQTPIMYNDYTESISAVYLLSNNKGGNTVQNLSSVIKRQKKDEVIELLREFDARINGIDILSDGIYLSMSDMTELVPLYMAGDGVRSFLDIILSVSSGSYNVVLIDEIDNGLHYTAHKLLWKTLLSMADRNGCQIFVTTHNLECLDSLNHLLEESGQERSSVALYTISQTKNGLKTYRNDGYGLQTAIEQEFEIRN